MKVHSVTLCGRTLMKCRPGSLVPQELVHLSHWKMVTDGVLTALGWLFGDKVAGKFCHVNDLTLIARASPSASQRGLQISFPEPQQGHFVECAKLLLSMRKPHIHLQGW